MLETCSTDLEEEWSHIAVMNSHFSFLPSSEIESGSDISDGDELDDGSSSEDFEMNDHCREELEIEQDLRVLFSPN